MLCRENIFPALKKIKCLVKISVVNLDNFLLNIIQYPQYIIKHNHIHRVQLFLCQLKITRKIYLDFWRYFSIKY